MRHRILRSTIAVVAVTGLFLGLPLMFYTWRWLDDTARTDLQHRLQRASSAILLQEQRTGVTDDPPVEALRLLTPSDGRLVLTYTDRTGASRVLAVGRGPLTHAMVEGTSLGDAGTLRIEQDYAGVRNDQFRALSIELIVMVLSLTAGVVVAAVTASRVADPVQEVASRAQRLANGDFRPDPHRHGIEELDRVLDVLDTATVEIADRLQRERQIVGDVSHQLRSRLTAIHIRLDELTLHADPEVVSEAQAALDQVDRLTSSVGDMVKMARSERTTQGTVDVRAELTPLLADLAPSFERAGRRLTVLPPDGPPLPARATATRVREAAAVLVDNALQHGRGEVTVRLGSVGAHTVLVTVSDEGAGISDADAQRIFRRGYSVGDGTGVGLALARAFVEGDGGRLQLQSRKPTTFAMFLPAAGPGDAPEQPVAREPEPR
ncbi:sensor histidine kinase [Tsukamurella paurometabola]|uniref:histidine kinase n=1 Tax=Tsukamurella paurometabola TaxID=2061 RepID=A0A3P8L7L5_TSUPA|nr:HAMP domain-containing sensor histidine kinase [Tsukamurella paurometabola]MBS4103842.1 HAMP domain-containing histidine kinase [Tsukamurella paurometabola]UEA82505.1 HAMP domain-containing histidine kinase [Tsukamurella paurometabola]VDR39561.1 Signal transduction histidine-protein kinase ArlS [Tsukamurella paurometabola]